MLSSHLALLKDITLGIAATSDHRAALTVTLEVLCTHFGIPAGICWTVEEDGALVPEHVHSEDGDEALVWRLHELVGRAPRAPREGVLGALVAGHTTSATWSLAQDAGLDELSEVLADIGFGATTAHAVVANGECVAILQLALSDRRRPDHEILAMVETVTTQLGVLIVRERAEEQARERAVRTKLILDSSADAFVSVGNGGLIRDWNRAAEELFGWTADEAMGMRLADTIAGPDARRSYEQGITDLVAHGDSDIGRRPFEVELRRRDGSSFTAEVIVWRTDLAGDDGVVSGFIRDVSDERARQAELAASREQLAQAQRVAQTGSWDYDAHTGVLSWSEQYCANLGLPPDVEPSDALLVEVCHPDDRDVLATTLKRVNLHPGPFTHEYRVVHPNGDVRHMRATGVSEHDDNGVVRCWGAVQDVTEEHRLREAIRHRNRHDALTDLVNRPTFQEDIQQALAAAAASERMVAVALLDLDRFADLNEQLGHGAADGLLIALADRLRATFGAPDAAAARVGGDEFAVLISRSSAGTDRTQTAEELATTIQGLLLDPIDVDGAPVRVHCCIGVAVHVDQDEEALDADTLLRHAALALDTAKARGTDTWQLFEPRMHAETLAQVALRSDVERAVAEDRITVHYQPVVSVSSGRTVGFEALARWNREGHGPVPPVVFIPIVEQLGLVSAMGRSVLRRACVDLARFRAVADETAELTVAVNLSVHQLTDPGLVEDVAAALEETGLSPEALVLEVTESALSDDDVGAVAMLRELEELGVQLAIDDFGTGYSSLARLKDYPAHLLKIDRSFLRDVTGPADEPAVLGALFALAETLGLRVVAEGVETPAQLAVVLAHDGEEAQGYLFGPPLPADDVLRLLKDPSWDLSPADSDDEDDNEDGRDDEPEVEHHQLAAALRQLVQAPSPDALDEVLAALAAVAGLAGARLVVDPPGEPEVAVGANGNGNGNGNGDGDGSEAHVVVPIRSSDGRRRAHLTGVYADPSQPPDGARALLELVGRTVGPLLDDLAV